MVIRIYRLIKMPIMYCAKCKLPVADSYHEFQKVCECIPIKEQKKRAKERGWKIKWPEDT